jgi:DNA-binding NarL/FixJ family response regulator
VYFLTVLVTSSIPQACSVRVLPSWIEPGLSAARVQSVTQLRKVQILLADDHPGLLESIRSLLEPTFDVVGCVGDGESMFDAAMKFQPDVIVSDISMPKLSGIEAANQLRESGCSAKVVFLTVHNDPDFVRAALRTGALGYVLKTSITTDLLIAIRETLAGRTFVSPKVSAE